jgi:branched-chain amino acid transport system substrate-binding protein
MKLITRRAGLGASAAALVLGGQARAADTVKIGQIAPTTGPNAQSGRFLINGAKLAVDVANQAGGVLGRQIELITEDDQTTNPGAVLAFSRLVSRGDIVAFVAPPSSTQTHAIAPDVLKAGRPVVFNGSDPALTHEGNRWLFRCRAHDGYSARVIAEYGVKDLGKRNWAIIHSTDAFGVAAMKLLVESLDKLGVKPVLVQGYVNAQADFTALVLGVRQSGADVIASYVTFPTDQALLARQIRQLGVAAAWIGSASITSATALDLAGAALFGTYAVVDFLPAANPEAAAFTTLYERTYKAPADAFGAYGYDDITALAHAISAAASTDSAEIRRAILAIRGLKGVLGTYNFDANGDGLRSLNVVRNDNGTIVFIRRVEFDA